MYGIFTYIWLISKVNTGKYTSPMDPMGQNSPMSFSPVVFVTLPNFASRAQKANVGQDAWRWSACSPGMEHGRGH